MPDTYDYLDNQEGWIKVKPTAWRWKAIYENGQELHQYNDATGRFHRFYEIDQSQLREFVMYSPQHPDQTHRLDFDPGDKLIHKYVRGRMTLPMDDGNTITREYFFYVFGKNNHVTTLDQKGNTYAGDNVAKWAEREIRREYMENNKQTR